MIRVLHVVHGMNCGGTENLIMNFYRNINREEVQFDFMVHTNERCFFDDEIKSLGGRIYRVPYYKMYNLAQYVKSIKHLFESHKEWSIVHGHLGSCACIYLRIAKKYGLYTIAHSHNLKNRKRSVKTLLYQLHAYLTRGVADFYFGCSKQSGIDRYGAKIANGENFIVIRNAIDVRKFCYNAVSRDRTRVELGVCSSELVIGNVARFNEQKNHLFLMEVFREVVNLQPNSKLVLVGEGELHDNIEKKAKALGVWQNIIMTGVRKDVNNMLNAFDCFVLPSLYEGLGIVLIEAQASGLPCLASKGRIPEESRATDLLDFVPLEDGPKAWAKQILIMSKSRERNDMCQHVVDSGYDIMHVTEQLQQFYKIHTK